MKDDLSSLLMDDNLILWNIFIKYTQEYSWPYNIHFCNNNLCGGGPVFVMNIASLALLSPQDFLPQNQSEELAIFEQP